MMAAYMLKPRRPPRPSRAGCAYCAGRWCLRHRWTTLGRPAVLRRLAALIPLLPTGFIPPDDNSQTQVYLELPPGSTLAQTRAAAEEARQR
jgi:multidrug efflux pump subunit AcrB